VPLGNLVLDSSSIHGTSAWAGSFHILEMGRHYQDYVMGATLPALPQLQAIPTAYPYQRLKTKIRATGVTANIGEAVAAVFTRRVLGAGVADIAHIELRRAFGKRKTPDYLLRIGPLLFPALSALNAAGPLSGGPEWWPAESKARSTETSAVSARRDAIEQLAVCWRLLRLSQPAAVGYGLVVTFVYQPPREVRATFIVPKTPQGLLTALTNNDDSFASLAEHLHGC
jgi:hypothetical protein